MNLFFVTSLHMNITAEKCCKRMENLFHVVISINPLTLESDWLLISPDGITLESSTKVMRIKEERKGSTKLFVSTIGSVKRTVWRL